MKILQLESQTPSHQKQGEQTPFSFRNPTISVVSSESEDSKSGKSRSNSIQHDPPNAKLASNFSTPNGKKSMFAKRSQDEIIETLDQRSRLSYPKSKYSRFCANIEQNASIFSKLTFAWTINILKVGLQASKEQRNLLDTELFDCSKEETPEYAFNYMKSNFTKPLRDLNGKYMQSRSEYVKETAQQKKDRKYDAKLSEETKQKLDKEKEKIEGMLKKSLFNFGSGEYIVATILSIIANLCQFAGPLFLKQIVNHIKYTDASDSQWKGYFYAGMIFVIFLIRVFLQQHSMQMTNRVALKVQNAINTSVFDKILTLSSSAKKYYDTGKMMTLVTVDSSSIFGYVMMASYIITSPIMVVVAVGFIVYELGYIGLATPVFFVIGAYLQKLVNAKAFKLRRLILTWTDKRSKQLNEFFESIRVVKYNGWEDMISARIGDIRVVETKNLLKNQIIKTIVEVIMNATPFVISLFIFGLYVIINGEFDPASAYTVLSLLNLLLNPLKMIVIVQLLQENATTSLTRITEFLMAEDKPSVQEIQNPDESLAIEIQNSDFAWESLKSTIHNQTSRLRPPIAEKRFSRQMSQISPSPFTAALTPAEHQAMRDLRVLKNINFTAKPGDTIAIVGQVASGKSSLLLAILGEMVHMAGNISVHGSFAYIPQTAWLINATLRDNILFGLPFDEEKYNIVLEKCQLLQDLANVNTFPARDKTLIGERGSNLSGGQRQRIGIARAVYSDSDILLIDDCLSALDAAVANAIYSELICGYLKGKTIVFVTHALHFIENIEKIVVVKEGLIVSEGSHTFLARTCEEYQRLTQIEKNTIKRKDSSDSTNDPCVSQTDSSDDDSNDEADMEEVDNNRIQQNGILTLTDQNFTTLKTTTTCDPKERSQQKLDTTERNISCQVGLIKPISNEEDRHKAELALDWFLQQRQERKMRKKQTVMQMHSEVDDFNFSAVIDRNFQNRKQTINQRTVKHSEQLQKQQTPSARFEFRKYAHHHGSIVRRSYLQKKGRTVKRQSTIQLTDLIDSRPTFQNSSVPFTIYSRYMKAGGIGSTFNTLFSFLVAQGLKVASDYWIGIWSDDSLSLSTGTYIYIFAILGILQCLFIYMRGHAFGVFTVNASNQFQKRLVQKLLKTPQWWYDVTPIGKILARTTKDQDDLDSSLPWNLKFALTNVFSLVIVTITIGIIFPYFLVIAVFAFYCYYLVVKFYMVTSREIKCLESAARSPVLSNYQETASGLIVIRAFKKESMFLEKTLRFQQEHLVSQQNQNSCTRWVSVITDLLGLLVVTCCAFFGVLSKQFNLISNVSLVALALSSSFQISQIISFTLKLLADTESNMNALVRIIEFIDKNPQENSWHESKPPQNWPSEGQIRFNNVSLRYRSDLPQVVNNLSLTIQSCQKIGVVGRTGCGKSTLTLGILRILEMTFDETNELGQIILDNIDIREIGIHELRQKVTIIPQDPILFSGTVRSNVDPFNQFADSDIVEVLKKVSIWEQLDRFLDKKQETQGRRSIITSTTTPQKHLQSQLSMNDNSLKLNITVDTGGANFSMGQRQLLCIARALIKQPKVLLMDEATASIDEMTDSIIQTIIKEDLKNTTVITIAHRLKTIIQYDKILVIEQGHLKEFDTPINLLNSADSYFKTLVNENGPAFFEEMKGLAMKKAMEKDNFNKAKINQPLPLPSDPIIHTFQDSFDISQERIPLNDISMIKQNSLTMDDKSPDNVRFQNAATLQQALKFRKSLIPEGNASSQMKSIVMGKNATPNPSDLKKEQDYFGKIQSNSTLISESTKGDIHLKEIMQFLASSDSRIPEVEEEDAQKDDTSEKSSQQQNRQR